MNTATNVHHSLQGAVIPSSGSVGMRIQYPFLYQIVLFNVISYRAILPILLVHVNWKLLPDNACV